MKSKRSAGFVIEINAGSESMDAAMAYVSDARLSNLFSDF
jgi:hypothetical protein